MKIDILTLFPKMFKGPFDDSIVKRAREKKIVEVEIHNLREWTDDRHQTVDGRPFGGGVGMVLKIEPIWRCVQFLKSQIPQIAPPIELLRTNIHLGFPSGALSGEHFAYPSGHLARTVFISAVLIFAIFKFLILL